MWCYLRNLAHLIRHRHPPCVLCTVVRQDLWKGAELDWKWYIGIAWLLLEYGLLRGR